MLSTFSPARRGASPLRAAIALLLSATAFCASAQSVPTLSCNIKTMSTVSGNTVSSITVYGPTLVAFRVPLIDNHVSTTQSFVNGGQQFRYSLNMDFRTAVPTGTSTLVRLTNGETSSRPLTRVQIVNRVGYFFDTHNLVPLELPQGGTNGRFNTFCSIGIGL